MFERSERAAVERALFDVVKRPLHFAFRLRPSRLTGDRPESVMRGEGQELRVVHGSSVFVPQHHDFHVVVQTCGGRSAEMFEGADVFAESGFQILRFHEVQILPPRIPEYVTEQVHAATAFV